MEGEIRMSGRIRKSKKEKNYTVIPNDILKSKDLTWKAKGLMCYLLHLSDEWEVYKSDLVNRSKDGYESMISGWKELEKLGYIETKNCRENGLFKGYEYIIHESPIRYFTESVLPESENPQLISNSNKQVTLEIKDTNVSNVGLGKPNTTDIESNFSERCRLFIELFNSIRLVDGKKSKFKALSSVAKSLKARLKDYTPEQIKEVIQKCMVHEFHVDSKFMYVTPEYVLREKIIDKYLNMDLNIKPKSETKNYVP